MKKTEKRTKAAASPIVREVWGIVFLFFGACALLALLSYNHSDPSMFTQTKRLPLNYVGRLGANIAEVLIQFAGLASYILTFLMLSVAVKLFRGARAAQLAANLFWHVISVITCATFISLVFGSLTYGGTRISSGGVLGAWLAGGLLHYLNLWGATLFTLCSLLIALVFSTPLSAATLFRFLSALTIGVGAWLATVFYKAARAIVWAAGQKRKTERLIEAKLKPEKPELEIGTRKAAAKVAAAEEEEEEIDEILPPKRARSVLAIGEDSFLEVIPPANAPPKKVEKKPARTLGNFIGAVGLFTLPPLDLLNEAPPKVTELDRKKLIENSQLLKQNLTEFGIEGEVVAVRPGPVITMYEFKPGPGVKISQIANLADDLSLALSAQSVRIVAPIPGKSVVGIEIPNDDRETVYLREILSTDEFHASSQGIPLAIGKDISGAPVVSDIARMPHLLIAGASGKGKSVFINSLICSLLYKFTPNDMRMIMVDPKQVELNLYEGIPHLLLPVVDDPKKAATALKWTVNEMERRYKLMAKSGMRNIAGFNGKLEKDGEEKMRTLLCPQKPDGFPETSSLSHLFEHDERGLPRIERLPVILVIIDEFADLMMTAPKDIEVSVARLGQKARAAGIHLVIATQRPSVDVITGLIKANLPSRVSFQTASKIDSRTILDGMGAEKLLGHGDMLFIPPGLSRLTRIHGAFVNEEEIGRICDHWKKQGSPVYKEEILIEPEEIDPDDVDGAGDSLYGQAVAIVREMGTASASMIQRRLKVGYNRAARMVEAMEAQGIVGPSEGAKPREVLY